MIALSVFIFWENLNAIYYNHKQLYELLKKNKKKNWRLHVHCGSRVLKNYLGIFMERMTTLLGILWLHYHGTDAEILKASTAYILL